jgi:hypothetical protein
MTITRLDGVGNLIVFATLDESFLLRKTAVPLLLLLLPLLRLGGRARRRRGRLFLCARRAAARDGEGRRRGPPAARSRALAARRPLRKVWRSEARGRPRPRARARGRRELRALRGEAAAWLPGRSRLARL